MPLFSEILGRRSGPNFSKRRSRFACASARSLPGKSGWSMSVRISRLGFQTHPEELFGDECFRPSERSYQGTSKNSDLTRRWAARVRN
jgi:hypothetical protein